MSDKTNKLGQGRPFKMAKWVDGLKEVLSDDNILFLSDTDLVFLVNQTIPEKDQISKPTFERWKAGKFHPDEEIGKEFIKCIQHSLIKQKQYLSAKMLEETAGNWQKIAWIMERKFSEWNLKHISENINKNEETTVIQISSQNDEQKALLDSIINGTEFIEVKPKQIQQKNNENEDEIGF